jgi:phosphonate transport system ATP-binding protein
MSPVLRLEAVQLQAVQLQAVRVQAAGRLLLQLPALQVAAGERVAIVGPNGAGKSTLLKLLAGQWAAQQVQGQVHVLGRWLHADTASALPPADAAARRLLRREVGLLLQGLHLVPRLTARENVLVGALGRLQGAQALRSWCRWYPPALVAEADAALARLGLADRVHTRCDQLSGGERQKVALARVQLQAPRLLLADEPTSALDPAATRQACAALLAAVAQPGCTLVTVVHDLALLPLLATRVIGLAEGRVCWDKPLAALSPELLQALYASPAQAAATAEAPDMASPQPAHDTAHDASPCGRLAQA